MKHLLMIGLVLLVIAGCDSMTPPTADDAFDAAEPFPRLVEDGAAELNNGDRSKRCRCTTRSRGRLTFAVGEGYQFIERRDSRTEPATYGLALLRRSGNRLVLGVFALKTTKRVCRLEPDPDLGKLIATYRLRQGRRVLIDELDTVLYWSKRTPETDVAADRAATEAEAATNAVQLPDVTLLYEVRPQQSIDPRPTPQPKPKPWFICPEFEVTAFTT